MKLITCIKMNGTCSVGNAIYMSIKRKGLSKLTLTPVFIVGMLIIKFISSLVFK